MNINSDFDLKKAKSFLLTENINSTKNQLLDFAKSNFQILKQNFIKSEMEMINDEFEGEDEERDEAISYLKSQLDVTTPLELIEAINERSLGADLDDDEDCRELFDMIKALVSQNETQELDEMAKIAGDLKSSIEAVIKANPDLQGLALKKAIKGDSAVINALDGEDLYDNQLNKFISLTKGERELGQRGRKADPNKPEAEPRVAKAPGEKKIKITTPKSEPSTDDTSIDTGIEKDARSQDEMIKAKRDLEAKRMEVAKAYKAGDTSVISKLKDLTAQINKLNKKLGV